MNSESLSYHEGEFFRNIWSAVIYYRFPALRPTAAPFGPAIFDRRKAVMNYRTPNFRGQWQNAERQTIVDAFSRL
jgi:hypothetical protein